MWLAHVCQIMCLSGWLCQHSDSHNYSFSDWPPPIIIGWFSDWPTNHHCPFSHWPTNHHCPFSQWPTNHHCPFLDWPTNHHCSFLDWPTNHHCSFLDWPTNHHWLVLRLTYQPSLTSSQTDPPIIIVHSQTDPPIITHSQTDHQALPIFRLTHQSPLSIFQTNRPITIVHSQTDPPIMCTIVHSRTDPSIIIVHSHPRTTIITNSQTNTQPVSSYIFYTLLHYSTYSIIVLELFWLVRRSCVVTNDDWGPLQA